jgi:uncharacterized protein involved in exopolysaccharide biosynthesis
LPWTLKNALGTAISESPTPAGTTDTTASTMLSKEEETALEVISGMVSTSVSEESGLMSISVTAGDPRLAADVAESFVNHLTSRVRALRTAKVRKRLRFVEERFREVEQELEATEERLARFLERNQNPTTASLRFRRDRLERQVRFKEQLYSDLQGQLTQTRLDLQRRQPVVTVVEQAVPPTKRTAPQRVLIVFLSLALGTVLGVGGALVNVFVGRDRRDDEREKVDEIKRRLIPKRWTVTE